MYLKWIVHLANLSQILSNLSPNDGGGEDEYSILKIIAISIVNQQEIDTILSKRRWKMSTNI